MRFWVYLVSRWENLWDLGSITCVCVCLCVFVCVWETPDQYLWFSKVFLWMCSSDWLWSGAVNGRCSSCLPATLHRLLTYLLMGFIQIASDCLGKFLGCIREFANANQFSNSIIKTDRGLRGSGEDAWIYFCGFMAALLDCSEGSRERTNRKLQEEADKEVGHRISRRDIRK